MRIRIPKPRNPVAQRQLELRRNLWPEATDEWLWSRHRHDGFTTIPKGMPLILSIMDDMSNGKPVSSTYFGLWCRTFDECFVTLSKPREMAFHAGFDGQRAERTWRGRLAILAEHQFISLAEGPSGPMSYALIWNPYKVIKWHHEQKSPGLRQDKYNALLERVSEIGDNSMADDPPSPSVVQPPSNWPNGVDPNAKVQEA
ncbi:hypothetical protein [Afipia felis]|uniref:Uncharacterized protein n=2 Tax=Afipia felis TaxID=1035 RepID=A0A380WBV3_AFIFE|nr:hypothetical protein [Afipia felis]EKS29702.1 hypothetical protein HMPREF9697_02230 [Afipia felis ATCC 53690]SUU78409.1 Uncharacterised protein [Afipia felis]SUU86474.1 Uncharacterised protein [Afipia felis]